MITITRRYYHHYGALNKKAKTKKTAIPLTLMGTMMTIGGIMSLVFLNAFGFGAAFGVAPYIMPIIFTCVGPILLIIGISFFVKAASMPEEEAPEAQIEYVRVSPRTDLSDLKCPACNAPLPGRPPCKCEYCQRMIRSL